MVNAPTRPPARPDGGRRPPRGPLVARSTDLSPQLIRARMTVAVDRLKDRGDADLAEALEVVLAPGGWRKLRSPSSVGGGNDNYALYMATSVKNWLEDAARETDPERAPGTVLAEVVNEGWEKFLTGDFQPAPLARAPRGKAPEKENLNLRPDTALGKKVEEASKQRGLRMSAGQIGMSYLYDQYGISDEQQIGAAALPLPPKYEGRELWTATDCAERLGMTRQEWQEDVDLGVVPRPVWVAPGQIPMWDAESVREAVK